MVEVKDLAGVPADVVQGLEPELVSVLRMQERLESIALRIAERVVEIRRKVLTGGDEKLSCDIGYIAQKAADAADNCRKQLEGLSEKAELSAALVQIQDRQSPEPIEGALCKGTVHADRSPKMPKKRVGGRGTELTPEFRMYLKALGASDEAIEKELLAPYWPGVKTEHTRRFAEGEPDFAGIQSGEDNVIYSLKYSVRKHG